MPYYKFHDTKTGRVWEEFLTISQRDLFLEGMPHIEQLVHGCPRIVSGVNTFGSKLKPDDEFRSKLKEIKKANPGSTIDSY